MTDPRAMVQTMISLASASPGLARPRQCGAAVMLKVLDLAGELD